METLEQINSLCAIITKQKDIISEAQKAINAAEKEIFKLTGGLDALTWLAQNEGSVE